MVKRYDFEKAKSIVESRKDEIIEASLGMYENGKVTVKVDGKAVSAASVIAMASEFCPDLRRIGCRH